MKKILVIQQDAGRLADILEVLGCAGYEAVGRDSGEAGIIRAVLEPPDLVLCDVATQRIDGFGVLWVLRRCAFTAKVPFVFLSAPSEHDALIGGMRMPANGYLSHPVSRNELLATVREFVS